MKRKTALFLSIYIFFTIIFTLSLPLHRQNHPNDHSMIVTVYHTKTGTVSEVHLEEYVAGVVSCEMPSSFHVEALKAQAVAARTFAVSRVLKESNPAAHPLAPLCDSTHCQAYSSHAGSASDQDKINTAVNATRSEMIYYRGKLIDNALYHSSSGGRTENSEDVFVSAIPYLKSVTSPYDRDLKRNGHGVGMSQYGANGMAMQGFSYKKILSHYYSGTVVH